MKKIGLFYATKADKTTWVAEKIQNAVRALDGNYYAVVNVERSYT